MGAYTLEVVEEVQHWTDRLFSFRTSRSQSLRFECGQFVMIGLEVDGRPLLRAYSMVSANYDDHLEFLSIKVPDGPLTSRLQHIKVEDKVLIGGKPTGTLIIDNLRPGRTLFLLATGTGIAPFMSIIRNPETYERFEKVVLVHGCRRAAELAYADEITTALPKHAYIGDQVRNQLVYFPTVTREPFRNQGRITAWIDGGRLEAAVGVPALSKDHDRVMLCGSPGMLTDLKTRLVAAGFQEGNSGEPGDFVIEKAFVDK